MRAKEAKYKVKVERWEEVTKRAQGDEALWHGVVEDQSVANVRGLHLSPGDDGADGFRIPDE